MNPRGLRVTTNAIFQPENTKQLLSVILCDTLSRIEASIWTAGGQMEAAVEGQTDAEVATPSYFDL